MIWIGTSGWVYRHWVGRFYPEGLPQREWLPFYAHHFPTVEINRSYYRLPTANQFRTWSDQVSARPDFIFAVKASRFLTHMKKLKDPVEPVARLVEAASGLSGCLGPFLYQLPPRWRANPERLEQFVAALPTRHQAAFEFRDPSWLHRDIFQILERAGCAVGIGVRGKDPSPSAVPAIGPFRYVRFHHGDGSVGLADAELDRWAGWIAAQAANGPEIYVYFNNDPSGHAIVDAQRLRDRLLTAGTPVV